MIKCTDYVVDGYKNGKTMVRASLIADTQAEVTAIGDDASTIDGLNAGIKLAFGSSCITVNSEYGTLDSSGTWVF